MINHSPAVIEWHYWKNFLSEEITLTDNVSVIFIFNNLLDIFPEKAVFQNI